MPKRVRSFTLPALWDFQRSTALHATSSFLPLLWRPQPCKAGLNIAKAEIVFFSPFIDIFRQHCKIAIIHPQQPLRHCRALCQGCNAADSDLWYNLPDVFDETIATQCAARMVIGAFTASSFFQRPSRAINAFAAPPSSPGHP